MSEPQSLLVAGDLHGDAHFTTYIYDIALETGADAVFQVGDFGYWEHMRGGPEFLDWCSHLATTHAIPLYWIDGNHENHTLLRARYGPGGPQHKPTPEGFWEIRDGVYYVPRGTRWVWSGRHLMGLGGAYSVDKGSRLDSELKKRRDHADSNNYRFKAGAATRPFDAEKHKLWWPEEELTNAEVAAALVDPTPLDVLFTHDKPVSSNPRWNRKAFDECLPNQTQIQTVVRTLTPKLLVHGHLHFRYTDEIRCGDDDKMTVVEGLDCNVDARYGSSTNPETAWMLLHLITRPDDTEDAAE